MSSVYGEGIPLSSGYRCPYGNASIAGASFRSYHMSGRAADVSVKSMAGVWNDWDGMTDEEKAEVKEIWEMLDHLTRAGHVANSWGSIFWLKLPDRHFHGAW